MFVHGVQHGHGSSVEALLLHFLGHVALHICFISQEKKKKKKIG